MQSDFEKKIAVLQSEYAKHLPQKIVDLEKLWHTIYHSNDKTHWAELTRIAHTLNGTAGTYGYHLISDVARSLESLLNESIDKPLSTVDKEKIHNVIQDLKQVSMQLGIEKHLPVIDNSFPQHEALQQRIIYILGADISALHAQFDKLKSYNYQVSIYGDTHTFFEAVFKDHPALILIDLAFVDSITDEFIARLRGELILTIYLSAKDSLEERLLAVRHGGQAFMQIPCESQLMTRSIDNLFQAMRPQAERILIVDDSESLTQYYSLILGSAGMLVEAINDPRAFLTSLQEFQPDIILMDINMPYVNGMELAQVVQQQENLSSIPIIFLSTISERSKQLQALSFAGDDFITKPIEPKYLLAAVRNRLMRSRIVRSRMVRDSLTNLYNHTMIHHQLEREIAISQRYHKPLCAALIDIDHFKIVNDTYGHQAGDKILHELSDYLQTHLRVSDVVGRYGGEEFLIILPDTPLKSAFNIINQLRKGFASLVHALGDTTICVTFSAGIASYPEFNTVSYLIKASDEALYLAKKAGRNQIITKI